MSDTLIERTLNLIASLPSGAAFRTVLTDVVAGAEVGPYLKFDNKLWVNTFGEMTPRDGGWTRLRLADPKTGKPRKTEVEIYWGKPGELSVYVSHRTKPTFKYENMGMYVPPFNPKEFIEGAKQAGDAMIIAKRIVMTAKKQGLPPESALAFAGAVAEDRNFHDLSRVLDYEGEPLIQGEDPVRVGDALDGIEDIGYFAFFVAGMIDKGVQAHVRNVVIEALQDFKEHDAKRNFRQLMRD